MYKNVGGKIKGIAKFITWLGIIPTIILFIIMVASGEDALIAISFVILIVGCIGSWLSSILLYAFGQLVENSDILAENSRLKDCPKEFSSEKEQIAYLLQTGKITQIEYDKRLMAIWEKEGNSHADF